jgi:hypothetical protein
MRSIAYPEKPQLRTSSTFTLLFFLMGAPPPPLGGAPKIRMRCVAPSSPMGLPAAHITRASQ